MDAPRAAAGWYPDDENGERYWDGYTWTEQRRRTDIPVLDLLGAGEDEPQVSSNHHTIGGRRVLLASVLVSFIVMAVVIGLAIAFGQTSQTARVVTAAEVTESAEAMPDPVYVPDGFDDLGNGLAFMWDNEDVVNKGCLSSIGSCGVLNVYATQPCAFVYASANLLDDAGTIVDSGNDTASGLTAGDTVRLTIQFTQHGPRLKLTDLHCS